MQIIIRALWGVLPNYGDDEDIKIVLEIADESKVCDLLPKLNISNMPVIVVWQGFQCSRQDKLKEGEEYSIVPILAGG